MCEINVITCNRVSIDIRRNDQSLLNRLLQLENYPDLFDQKRGWLYWGLTPP